MTAVKETTLILEPIMRVTSGALFFWILCAAWFFASANVDFLFSAQAATRQTKPNVARLVRVHDGDTITAQVGRKKWRVRLLGIDAPELAQDFGPESKAALEAMLDNSILLKCQRQKDRYQRRVCDVFTPAGLWVNEKMVTEGWAWHYDFYSSHVALKTAQQQARRNKKGLWQSAKPQAPWVWRRHHPRSH